MARSRNIKPGFFTDDELGELDPLARILFIGMWTIADYKGDFEWRPKKIKIELLPWDECNIESLAINLDKSRFIRFYSDGNKIYCRVVNFDKHQNPHKNEKAKGSEIPAYSEKYRQLIDLQRLTINRDSNGTTPDQNGTDPADSLNLIPDSLNLIPDSSETPPPTRAHACETENSNDEPGEGWKNPTPYEIGESPPPANKPIPEDYKPPPEILDHLNQSGVPSDFVDFQLVEFRAYWKNRGGGKTSWDSAFLSRCVTEWKRRRQSWVSASKPEQSMDEKIAILNQIGNST